MNTALRKVQAGTNGEIVDSAGDEYLAGASHGTDPSCDMDRDACNVGLEQLALPCVQPGAYLEP